MHKVLARTSHHDQPHHVPETLCQVNAKREVNRRKIAVLDSKLSTWGHPRSMQIRRRYTRKIRKTSPSSRRRRMNLARFDPERKAHMDDRRSKKPRHPGARPPQPQTPHLSLPRVVKATPGWTARGRPSRKSSAATGWIGITSRTVGHVKLDVTAAAAGSKHDDELTGRILGSCLLKCVAHLDIFGQLKRVGGMNQCLRCITPRPWTHIRHQAG